MRIRKKISFAYHWITNPDNERIVSKKIYLNYILLWTAITFFLFVPLNIVVSLHLLAIICFIAFVTIVSIWVANRKFEKTTIPYIGAGVFILSITNILFILNNGLSGPVLYFLFPLLFIIIYFGNKGWNIYFILIVIINLGFLQFLEFYNIIEINPYENRLSQFFDFYLSGIISIFALLKFLSDIIKIQTNEKMIAQESNKLKTAFLANTSHDIRTPVASIHGFCTLLNEEGITEEEIWNYTKIIESNSNQLISLINDIFDISIIDSGNFALRPKYLNLNDLLDESKQNFIQVIKKTGKKINLHVHIGLPHKQSIIYADSVRITQILANLLQNSVNHTNTGAIIFGYKKELNSNSLVFYVKDTGSGIPDEKIDTIFDRNITNVSNSDTVSTGLGLHITKTLITLMKGDIWVESVENEGTHFYFKIPYNTKPDFN